MPPKKPQPKPDPNKDIGKFFSVAQYQERAQGRVDRAKEVERGREQAEALEKKQAKEKFVALVAKQKDRYDRHVRYTLWSFFCPAVVMKVVLTKNYPRQRAWEV